MAWPFRRSVAAVVGIAAFALYRSTLLPGFDFGDTASFQVMAGSPFITPRDGYPLYFAIGALFTWLNPGDPAHAMNLASAAAGAVGCSLIVLLAFELSGSLPAAVAAAAVFGGSYTFWSQSVIAEVYALHICLIAGTLILILRWERRPTTARLAAFFGIYAIGFGNHLSMILLLPGCALFLLLAAPGGWRSIVSPRVAGLAAGIAGVASLQYLWNVRVMWIMAQRPGSVMEGLRAFWFDVTKSDWRDTMILEVPSSMTLERLRMYGFDVTQQFGWILPLVALAGFYRLARTNRRRAVLLALVYAANVLFALGYNVGDSHVFFLPSHLVLALLVAPGIAPGVAPGNVLFDRPAAFRAAAAALVLTIAGVRMYRDYPALDRGGDGRPRQVLDTLAARLSDRSALLFTDLNWQIQNGLTYYAGRERTDLAVVRMPEVLLYAPALLRDNLAIDRHIVVSERAGEELTAAYGPLYSAALDPDAAVPRLSDSLRTVPMGTRYVLSVLRPTREFAIDQEDVSRTVSFLTGGRTGTLPTREYVAIAGVAGGDAAALFADDRPFARSVVIDGVRVDVRMDSWLAFDTIRRMGFGHVIAARHHTLIVERGVSFAAFDDRGRPVQTAYRANIFAPQPRWFVTAR
jgi:hypothetical protein